MLAESQHGADHPSITSARAGLAAALEAVGEPRLAEAEYRSAIEVCDRARGPMHITCGKLYDGLAVVLTRNDGRHAEALTLFEHSLQIAEATYGPEDPAIVQYLSNLAFTLLELGEPADAHAHFTRALAMEEKAHGPDSLGGAYFLFGLGRAELDLERPAAARPLLERVLALRERLNAPPGEIAQTRFQLARALWSTPADRARAIELARQAETVLRGIPYLKLPHAEAVAWLEAAGHQGGAEQPSAGAR